MMKRSIFVAAVALAVVHVLPVRIATAALVDFYVAANAGQIVGGGVESDGTGAGWLRLNAGTNTIEWSIIYGNLTGDPTMAHFHGPAEPGENAGVQVALDHTLNPMIGSALISDVQEVQLLENLWYVNIHTEAYPAGEIRGQVIRVIPEPATVALLALGGLFLLRQRRTSR